MVPAFFHVSLQGQSGRRRSFRRIVFHCEAEVQYDLEIKPLEFQADVATNVEVGTQWRPTLIYIGGALNNRFHIL